MKKFKTLMILLVSSLSITGISFIDGKIWDAIFYIIGISSYFIVGVLISFGFLSTKKAREDAYVIVFVALAFSCLWVYNMLVKFKTWLDSIPITVKIIVPCMLAIVIIALIILESRRATVPTWSMWRLK